MNFVLITILFHVRLMIENDIYILIDFINLTTIFSFFQKSNPNEFICPSNFFDNTYENDYIFNKIHEIAKNNVLNNEENDKEKTFIKNIFNIENKTEKKRLKIFKIMNLKIIIKLISTKRILLLIPKKLTVRKKKIIMNLEIFPIKKIMIMIIKGKKK